MEDYTTDSVMQIRLDTSKFLETVKNYLEGRVLERKVEKIDNDYVMKDTWNKTGDALLNEKGMQVVMGKISSLINPSIAQGNIDKFDDLRQRMSWFREDLNHTLMLNINRWDIQLYNYSYVMDFICDQTSLFLSRLVGNKERESYTHTLKTQQISKIEDGKNSDKFNVPKFI